jgi:D-alanine-D-alanine ligase-like ATP-grasp enzyme
MKTKLRLTESQKELQRDSLELRSMRGRSLIVDRMRPKDIARFHDAHISYSGATGIDADTGEDNYIATTFDNLHRILDVLKWKRIDMRVDAQEGQVVIRRQRKKDKA